MFAVCDARCGGVRSGLVNALVWRGFLYCFLPHGLSRLAIECQYLKLKDIWHRRSVAGLGCIYGFVGFHRGLHKNFIAPNNGRGVPEQARQFDFPTDVLILAPFQRGIVAFDKAIRIWPSPMRPVVRLTGLVMFCLNPKGNQAEPQQNPKPFLHLELLSCGGWDVMKLGCKIAVSRHIVNFFFSQSSAVSRQLSRPAPCPINL